VRQNIPDNTISHGLLVHKLKFREDGLDPGIISMFESLFDGIAILVYQSVTGDRWQVV